MAKLLGASIITNSCNGALHTSNTLGASIIEDARVDWEAKTKMQDNLKLANGGVLPDGVKEVPPLKVYTVLCWHHLRNV